jgi:taurine dioxygenase
MTGISFEPRTGYIGATLHGLNLSDGIDEHQALALKEGLDKYKTIFLPRQSNDPVALMHFSRRLGPLERHHHYSAVAGVEDVVIIESNREKSTKDDVWHTDGVYRKEPPMYGVLQAIVLPSKGGDTIWMNMGAAFADLSRPTREYLMGLRAIHDVFGGYGNLLSATGDAELGDHKRRSLPPVSHPVVRTHPRTGEKILFVNPTYVTMIEGLSRNESAALLDMLFKHIGRPEYQVRQKWTEGDVAIWDNAATLHYAVADYAPEYRRMHRVSVAGPEPR